MGLTVHFKLAPPHEGGDAKVKQWVAAMRRLALRFQREGWVDKVHPITGDPKVVQRIGLDWLILPVPGQLNTVTGAEVVPIAGWLFRVDVGRDCEPLWLGLCRYPLTVRFQGRDLRTKKGGGWRLFGFSKTQYASLHGWEHFLRCHRAVVELLAALRTLGMRVRINDEGDYWPRRSVSALRAEVGRMNELIAASVGALKDGPAGVGIESPILQHAQFERLEAAGEARVRPTLKKLRAAVGKLRTDDRPKK
jgi:hypothetical protein